MGDLIQQVEVQLLTKLTDDLHAPADLSINVCDTINIYDIIHFLEM